MKVALLGHPGSYSEGAAVRAFGEGIEPVRCARFEEIFAAVEAGRAERGLVPIENSLTGSLHRSYDLLLRHELQIVGEVHLKIEHLLLALPGVPLGDVRRVLSHPQALAQCEAFLRRLGVPTEATLDTAGAARRLREEGLRDAAAIAGPRAARVYGLAVLAEGIADEPENYTRFLILSREAVPPPEEGPAKTSVVFTLENKPGALFKALSVFALREIDLTKIESRPLRGRPWEYLFYLDFAASLAEERARNALRHLGEIAPFLRVLGSYPRDLP